MPLIKIDLWEGRTPEQKEKIISSITKAMCESVGCPEKNVHVIIQEHKKEDWGIGGSSAAKQTKG
jgi:4-oxalocrotonate tautomerase